MKNIILKKGKNDYSVYKKSLMRIFCPNPVYLYEIINIIKKENFDIAVSFNILKDESSNNILNMLTRKNIVKILDRDYFDNSKNKYMILEFEEGPINNIKYHLSEIVVNHSKSLSFNKIIYYLHNDYGYSFEEIKKYKKRIITYLYIL